MAVRSRVILAGDIIRYDKVLWVVRTLDKKRHVLVRVKADQTSVEPQYSVMDGKDRARREVAIVHLNATAEVVQSFGQ